MTESPWLTTAEAAARLRKSPGAFRTFLCRERKKGNKYAINLKTSHVGGLNLYKASDVDQLVGRGRARLEQAS